MFYFFINEAGKPKGSRSNLQNYLYENFLHSSVLQIILCYPFVEERKIQIYFSILKPYFKICWRSDTNYLGITDDPSAFTQCFWYS